MAKRTRAQIEAAMTELQSELDTADTDDEIWIRDPKSGHEVKVSGRRATTVLDRFKELFEGDGKQGDGEEGDGEQGDEPDPQPGGGDGGYFRGRRR